jgi:hypothetical protein
MTRTNRMTNNQSMLPLSYSQYHCSKAIIRSFIIPSTSITSMFENVKDNDATSAHFYIYKQEIRHGIRIG